MIERYLSNAKIANNIDDILTTDKLALNDENRISCQPHCSCQRINSIH